MCHKNTKKHRKTLPLAFSQRQEKTPAAGFYCDFWLFFVQNDFRSWFFIVEVAQEPEIAKH